MNMAHIRIHLFISEPYRPDVVHGPVQSSFYVSVLLSLSCLCGGGPRAIVAEVGCAS